MNNQNHHEGHCVNHNIQYTINTLQLSCLNLQHFWDVNTCWANM